MVIGSLINWKSMSSYASQNFAKNLEDKIGARGALSRLNKLKPFFKIRSIEIHEWMVAVLKDQE